MKKNGMGLVRLALVTAFCAGAYVGCAEDEEPKKSFASTGTSDAAATSTGTDAASSTGGSDSGGTTTQDSGGTTPKDSGGTTVTDTGAPADTGADTGTDTTCTDYCACMASTCAFKNLANCLTTCQGLGPTIRTCRKDHCGYATAAGSNDAGVTMHCDHAVGVGACT